MLAEGAEPVVNQRALEDISVFAPILNSITY